MKATVSAISSDPSKLFDVLDDFVLKRVHTTTSLLSGVTLVDDLPSSRTRHRHSLGKVFVHAQSAAVTVTCVLWLLGATQVLQKSLYTLIGCAILRAARPHDPAFAVDVVAAMRVGALGGAVVHAMVVCAVCILLSLCNRSEERYNTTETGATSPPRLSFREKCEISIVCLTFTIGCSAAAGALGARMVKGTAPGSMNAKNGMITTLVGWAVLYVPRRAVVWFSRRVLRDGHRAATVGEVAPRGRVDRRGDVTVV